MSVVSKHGERLQVSPRGSQCACSCGLVYARASMTSSLSGCFSPVGDQFGRHLVKAYFPIMLLSSDFHITDLLYKKSLPLLAHTVQSMCCSSSSLSEPRLQKRQVGKPNIHGLYQSPFSWKKHRRIGRCWAILTSYIMIKIIS